MRPPELNPRFVEATKLRGVGPKVAAALDRLLGAPARPARMLDSPVDVVTTGQSSPNNPAHAEARTIG